MTAAKLGLVATALAIAVACGKPPPQGAPGLRLARAGGGSLVHVNSRASKAVIAAGNMRPGQTESGLVRIANGRRGARLWLSARVARDEPGVGGRRLSDRLRLAVDDVTDPRRVKHVAAGRAADGCRSLGPIRAKGTRVYRFSATFPDGGAGGADNAYARSSVRVDYRWIEAASAGPCTRHLSRTRHARTHTIRATTSARR